MWKYKCANLRRHACAPVIRQALRRTRLSPRFGPVSKATPDQTREEYFYAKRQISDLLLSQDCLQIMVPLRPLHRHRRTRQVHFQVQQQGSDEPATTKLARFTKNRKIKRGMTIEHREVDCETLPESLVEVTDNLEDAGVLAPAHNLSCLRFGASPIERRDPLCSNIPEWLQEFRRKSSG